MEEKTLFGSFYNLFVSIAFSALFLSTLTEGFVGEVAFYNLAHVSSVFEDVLIQAIVRTSLLVVLTHFVLKVTFEINSPLIQTERTRCIVEQTYLQHSRENCQTNFYLVRNLCFWRRLVPPMVEQSRRITRHSLSSSRSNRIRCS